MRTKYISQVKRGISIYARQKTTNIMDGSYLSIYKGRTMNFEDLREYVVGDSIKDIDWKSSARTQTLLVRQYIAEKKHNVLILMDTGRKMLADTPSGDSKKDVALYSAGTVAYIANNNRDYVGIAYKHNDKMELFKQHSNIYEVERMLAFYDHDVAEDTKETNLDETICYISRKLKKKSIIFIITDIEGMNRVEASTLKRLSAKNDVLCILVEDAGMEGKQTFDVESDNQIPAIFLRSKKLHKIEANQKYMMQKACEKKFLQCNILSTSIGSQKEIAGKIIKLLGSHRYANRS